jgi:hypothetical protein
MARSVADSVSGTIAGTIAGGAPTGVRTSTRRSTGGPCGSGAVPDRARMTPAPHARPCGVDAEPGTDSADRPSRGTRRPRVHRARGGTLPRTVGTAPAATRGRDRAAEYRADAHGNTPADGEPPFVGAEVPAAAAGASAAGGNRREVSASSGLPDGRDPGATDGVTAAGDSRSTMRAQHVDPRRRSRRSAVVSVAHQARPRVGPVDPQRAINRRWEQWLARRYPGTRWEIVRDVDVDGRDGVAATDAGQVAGAARVVAGPQTSPGLGGAAATGHGDDLEPV